jgi:hypothetical protein
MICPLCQGLKPLAGLKGKSSLIGLNKYGYLRAETPFIYNNEYFHDLPSISNEFFSPLQRTLAMRQGF